MESSNFRDIIIKWIVQESIHHIQRRNNMILDFIHSSISPNQAPNFTFNVIYYKILIHFAKSNRISGWCVWWMKNSIRLMLCTLNESKVRINRGTRTKFGSIGGVHQFQSRITFEIWFIRFLIINQSIIEGLNDSNTPVMSCNVAIFRYCIIK